MSFKITDTLTYTIEASESTIDILTDVLQFDWTFDREYNTPRVFKTIVVLGHLNEVDMSEVTDNERIEVKALRESLLSLPMNSNIIFIPQL